MTKRKSVFEKIEEHKNLLAHLIKNKCDNEVKLMLCHCWYYKIDRHNKLTQEERILYDFLNKNGVSAKTLYRHFTLLNYSQNIKELLHKKKVSIETACSRNFALTKLREGNSNKEIMDEIKLIIGGLEWKNLNKPQMQM